MNKLKLILVGLLISSQAFAGLPPTTSKGAADSSDQATLKYRFPYQDVTHSGVIATIGTAPSTSGNVMTSNGTQWISSALPSYAYASKTANYTLTSSDSIVSGATSGGAFTLTLPTAVGITGKVFYIKKTDNSTNGLTVATTSSQTIDGSTSRILYGLDETLAVVSDGANWKRLAVQAPRSSVTWIGSLGRGTGNTKIRRPSTVTTVGTAITSADSSLNGGTLTINEDGVYSMSYTDYHSTSICGFGISRNSSQLSTTITSITDADALIITNNPSTVRGNVSVTVPLSAGDVIRAHDDGTCEGASSSTFRFRITKVSN